jgi:hypothetical protein
MACRLPSIRSRPAQADPIAMARLPSRLCLVLLAVAWLGAVQAREEIRPFPAGRLAALDSCAGGSPIRFQAEDRRVLLEAVDAATVGSALARRYPVIDRDGLLPDGIVLWRKPNAGWLFVALLANPARPAEVCFTATFVAGRFDITAALLMKYFGAGVARE